MIFDYHSHISWDSQTACYNTQAVLDDMKKNNITLRMVSALYGPGISEQNDCICELVKTHPDKIIGCAVLNPKDPNCLKETERIIKNKCFKAIELDSLEHNYFPEEQKNILDSVFEMAQAAGLPVNVFTGWGCRTMPAQWAFYAKRHPKVQMVMLHMGTTDFGYGLIDLIPQYDNLFVETSCLYELPILRKAFSKISHDKFLFGSHFPHKFTTCSIHTFDLLKLPKETLDKLYYSNAMQLLKLNGGD